jgi:beta-glucosidase
LKSTFIPAKGSDSKYYVKTTVTNTGKLNGSEVVQVYLSVPSGGYLTQPPRRLVGFRRVIVARGASVTVTIPIDPSATNHPLSIWDKAKQQFVVPSGKFTIYAGNSSKNFSTLATFQR